MFKVQKDYGGANISRTIRFTDTLFEELASVSEEEGVSFNLLVLQCCRYALDHRIGEENPASSKE